MHFNPILFYESALPKTFYFFCFTHPICPNYLSLQPFSKWILMILRMMILNSNSTILTPKFF